MNTSKKLRKPVGQTKKLIQNLLSNEKKRLKNTFKKIKISIPKNNLGMQ